MKHTDELIKEIFSNKLGEYESHVSPELWSNIASQLPQAAATATASTTAVVVKTISAKLIWTAAIVAVTVASVVTYLVVSSDDPETTANAQKTEQPATTTAPTSTEAETNSNTETTNNTATTEVDTKAENPASTKPVAPQKALNTSTETKAIGKTKSQIPHSYPIADIAPAPQQPVAVTPPATGTPKTSDASSSNMTSHATVSKQSLTAQFTTASVNKEELRYFFMPEVADAQSYLWDFGNGHTSTEVSPMHTFDEEGSVNVHLTVVGKDGSKKEYTQKLNVFEPGSIEVPNVFTPNGDGQNDYFDVLEKSKNADIQKIVVFSSTDKIFESDGDRLWDGSDLHGNPLPAGEYKYFVIGVDKEGNKLEKKGFVTLRRQ